MVPKLALTSSYENVNQKVRIVIQVMFKFDSINKNEMKYLGANKLNYILG